MQVPQTRYATAPGGARVAYQLVGDGPRDILLNTDWLSSIDLMWDEPRYEHCLRRLASHGRLILFDKRGTGASDPLEVRDGAFGVSLLDGIFLWILGPYVYRFWLHQDVKFDATCFHVLLLVAIVNSMWDMGAVIPMSVNGHLRIALLYSVAAILSLALAWILLPGLGAVGAAIALAAMDGVMAVYVLLTGLERTKDTMKNFVTSLFTLSGFRRALQIVPSA